jgi:xanthine/CO dehydrogenase XdhC/CoxF family maturation factor
MPRASQAPRKRITCRSTKFISAKSIVRFGAPSPICFSNSPRCSPRIHPINRMIVPRPSVYLSRSSAASRTRFPQADVVLLCHPEQARDQVHLTSDTVAVVMTHNYRNDLRLLELLLPSSARYVGLLGSKARSARLLQELDEAAVRVTAAQRRRFHAPIGLDIGAETPEEIALAIVAEIRAVLAGRAGRPLRERRISIHERARSDEIRLPQMLSLAESASR